MAPQVNRHFAVEEAARLRSQSVTLKTGRGQHGKYPRYAFTEQGVVMLSSVLFEPFTKACDGVPQTHFTLVASLASI